MRCSARSLWSTGHFPSAPFIVLGRAAATSYVWSMAEKSRERKPELRFLRIGLTVDVRDMIRFLSFQKKYRRGDVQSSLGF